MEAFPSVISYPMVFVFVWFGNYFSLDMTVDIRRVLTIAAVMVTDGDKFFNSLVHCAVPNKD